MQYILVTYLGGTIQQVLKLEREDHGILYVQDDQDRSGMIALSSLMSCWVIQEIEYKAMLQIQKQENRPAHKSGLVVPKV